MTLSTQNQESSLEDIIHESSLWPYVVGLLNRPVAFEQLFDEIPIGIVILDKDRNVVFFNQAAQSLTGFSRREVYGLPCMHVVRSRSCDRHCPVASLSVDSEPVSIETDIVNRQRQKIAVRVTAAPLNDPNGALVGYIESIEDIQLLKKLDREVSRTPSFEQIIGQSPKMRKIFDILPVIASSDSSVLITGQTGSGKDFLAEAIHNASDRAKGSFIKVNCGALPDTLIESELFGHVKGAFTGAVENKPGRFKLAHNGTLYLTEIGDLPLQSQVKLLMFLDDQIIFPVGGVKGSRVNVRVIAGTHRNLEEMAQQGQFRDDLLFRLNVLRIHLPPLRERRDDVLLLMDHFLAMMSARLRKKITGFSTEARNLLTDYGYPGNVRELRNIIEYAANVCDGSKIGLVHLPAYMTEIPQQVDIDVSMERQVAPQNPTSNLSGQKEETWAAAEKRLIMDALIKSGGKKKQAAELLGWGRSTLWRKIRKYGIDKDAWTEK